MIQNNIAKITLNALIRILSNLSTIDKKLNIKPGEYSPNILIMEIDGGPNDGRLVWSAKDQQAYYVTDQWFNIITKKKEETLDTQNANSIVLNI
jgi:hypothetical protein